ncbi:GspE/PulE family protein [Planctomicrobium piriforme]|uniref:General secretion pathway protein E n=1 Tax=Planctomicrobium piriforme TaxID=1576369 RepID=A0A1I3F5H8_9PLAN|nr:GspE/PulE family protein [Planctomicrobium piriforme]SFI06457.1 general secretion pathway protein E [Planctomicrobium piriforme]
MTKAAAIPLVISQPARFRTVAAELTSALQSLSTGGDTFAVAAVDALLRIARDFQASDLHLQPDGSRDGLQVLFRIDGVLQPAGVIQQPASQIVPRLKVLANLLTYRTDVPQEGRIRSGQADLEMRVSTFPTIHGEKAVVRFFVASGKFQQLDDLGMPPDVRTPFERLLSQTTGLLVVCGPAGSGKTTTLYAAMRHIQLHSTALRSLCSLEDPVEALLPGVAQSQVKPEGEFTYQRGLASLLRQDPEVILVGEIRDKATAEIVFQASLTGQLVLTSFHAGSAADAISRLSDMGIEPYVLRSGLRGILSQRLLRRLCTCDSRNQESCPTCKGTGYHGRLMLCELLLPELSDLGRAILNRDDAEHLQELAVEAGMIPLRERGHLAVEAGLTTLEELTRVFGPQK